jgi:hypothetical protein
MFISKYEYEKLKAEIKSLENKIILLMPKPLLKRYLVVINGDSSETMENVTNVEIYNNVCTFYGETGIMAQFVVSSNFYFKEIK